MLFLENEEQACKKTSEQYFAGKTNPIYEDSAIFERSQKWLKNVGDVLALGLSTVWSNSF